MPNRDLSRASALSRFDTAEPAEVADWGGMRPAADEAEQSRQQDWRQAEVPLSLSADGYGGAAFDQAAAIAACALGVLTSVPRHMLDLRVLLHSAEVRSV